MMLLISIKSLPRRVSAGLVGSDRPIDPDLAAGLKGVGMERRLLNHHLFGFGSAVGSVVLMEDLDELPAFLHLGEDGRVVGIILDPAQCAVLRQRAFSFEYGVAKLEDVAGKCVPEGIDRTAPDVIAVSAAGKSSRTGLFQCLGRQAGTFAVPDLLTQLALAVCDDFRVERRDLGDGLLRRRPRPVRPEISERNAHE